MCLLARRCRDVRFGLGEVTSWAVGAELLLTYPTTVLVTLNIFFLFLFKVFEFLSGGVEVLRHTVCFQPPRCSEMHIARIRRENVCQSMDMASRFQIQNSGVRRAGGAGEFSGSEPGMIVVGGGESALIPGRSPLKSSQPLDFSTRIPGWFSDVKSNFKHSPSQFGAWFPTHLFAIFVASKWTLIWSFSGRDGGASGNGGLWLRVVQAPGDARRWRVNERGGPLRSCAGGDGQREGADSATCGLTRTRANVGSGATSRRGVRGQSAGGEGVGKRGSGLGVTVTRERRGDGGRRWRAEGVGDEWGDGAERVWRTRKWRRGDFRIGDLETWRVGGDSEAVSAGRGGGSDERVGVGEREGWRGVEGTSREKTAVSCEGRRVMVWGVRGIVVSVVGEVGVVAK
ncbi:hypothetical protein R3P38DRAFT_2764932 [Favolaschia claudopus]|uniref:Uncharacterized protein n=1 Tax=Favolaschia claudopus TaxID=2862362 RepID=A0AAW0DES7_9AGAR